MVGPLRQDPQPQKAPPVFKPEYVKGEGSKPKPMTVGGAVENTVKDAFDLAKGLFDIVPATAKRVMEIANNPEQYAKDFNLLFGKGAGNMGDVVSHIAGELAAPYKKHGARVLYERPVNTALDVLTLISLGGGSIARMGKLAQVAKGAGAAAGKAEKLIALGEKIQKLPGEIMRKAIDKSVLKATGGGWDLAKRRDALALKSHEQASALVRIEEDLRQTVGPKVAALNPTEGEMFYKAIRFGDDAKYGVADDVVRANPKVQQAVDSWVEWVKKKDPDGVNHGPQEFYKARKMLDDAAMDEALVKKFATDAGITVEEAAQRIAATGRKPVYLPHVPEKGAKVFTAEDVIDDLMKGPKAVREGKVGALETFTGKAPAYIKDPKELVKQAVIGFRKTEAKARFAERLLQEKQLIKAREGTAIGESLTHESIPYGIHQKYFEDRVRAEALRGITDPTIKRILKWEYTKREGALIRMYDRIISVFAKMATKWNPNFYTGQAMGDAFMGALAGSDWLKGRQGLLRRAMPPEVLARTGMADISQSINPSKIERATEIANSADQFTRAGIWHRSVAQDLKETALSFEGSAASMEDVARSTSQFSDVQVGMQLLEEKIARSNGVVQKLDRDIVRLEAREQKLAAKLEASEQTKLARHSDAKTKAEELRATAEDVKARHGDFVSVPADAKATSAEQAYRDATVLGRTGEKGFEKGMALLQKMRQELVNKNAVRKAVVRDIADDMAKSGALEARIPGLRQQVDIARRGIERSNTFIGDYLGLDGFEQQVLKRAIPFYSWTKAMTMLAFRLPFIAPVKTFMWHRYAQMMMDLVNDPEMPEWTRGMVPMFAREDGSIAWLRLSSMSPFAGLKTSEVGGVPVPGMFNLAERNPLIGLAFRIHGGKTIFDASTIPYGEQMVNIATGEVVEFTQQGKLRKVVPQSPLVSSIVHMFPITQLLESIAAPYWTNKYNWVGYPEPILNADGTYKYPRELWDRFSKLIGVNVMTRKKEDLIRSEKIKVMQAVRALEKAYAKGDADERELIKQALQDYSGGSYRKFESR